MPANTEELVENNKYAAEVEKKILPAMQERIRTIMDKLIFMGNHSLFNSMDIKQNKQLFHW